ncbi:hypothetical protein V6N13_125237 [Hibiscus sabdariffa]
MSARNPNANASELFVPNGRPPDGVVGVTCPLDVSGPGVGFVLGGGPQMDTIDVETNPHGLGDASVLVDTVNGKYVPKPSFRDIVGGGVVTDQQDNIIDSLYVSLNEEDVRAIEYEGLPVICFGCGKYGHSKEVCSHNVAGTEPLAPGHKNEPHDGDKFGPWMQALELLGEDDHRDSTIMEQDFGQGSSRVTHLQGSGVGLFSCFEIFAPKDTRPKKKDELSRECLVAADWASKFASTLNTGNMNASSSEVQNGNTLAAGDVNKVLRVESLTVADESSPLG